MKKLFHKKPEFSVSHNTIRNLFIVTRRRSNFDKQYFEHPDWLFPIFDVTEEQMFHHIDTYLNVHPDGYIKIVGVTEDNGKTISEYVNKKCETINII